MNSVTELAEFEEGLSGVATPGGDSLPSHSARWLPIAGALITALVTFLFLMLFWNRFLGTEVWRWRFHRRCVFSKGDIPVSRLLLSGPAPLHIPQCGGAGYLRKVANRAPGLRRF